MNTRIVFIVAGLIGLGLFYIRLIAPQFYVGTTTFDHPYIQFTGALILAGSAWCALIYILKRVELPARSLGALLGIAILYRFLMVGTVPIYENDWNRYLWDGAVTAQGINPYKYSPQQALKGEESENAEIQQLHDFSNAHNKFPNRINYEELTTIYPPVAQIPFTVAAFIDPLNLDVLRIIFIAIDGLSFFLLIKALQAYGRDPKWALLYALNPLLVYAGFNAAHMDLMLLPPLLLCLIWVKNGKAPFKAAVALAVASAVKLWPLILAPVFFRRWRAQPVKYILIAASVACVSFILNAPLLATLWAENSGQSGLSAYSGRWLRSSFLFPMAVTFLEPLTQDPDRVMRGVIALTVTATALYLGFRSKRDDRTLPCALIVTAASLLFLSPTGFPWYLYWVFVFFPFVPSYGLGLLSVLVSLYYVRYAMSERDVYAFYEFGLVPLQFGLPLIVIIYEIWRYRKKALQ